MSNFFRFPHTPHLAWLGQGTPRDDKVLSPEEVDELLSTAVVIEEKLDGANLGFSVSPDGDLRAQNRGTYLHSPHGGQFSRLDQWLAIHESRLFDVLDEYLILFGEWCAARHSLDYSSLPDWWLLFDVYDRRERRFWSTRRRDALARKIQVATAPYLLKEKVTLKALKELVSTQQSKFRSGPLEGVIVRREDDDWLHARGKLVRAEFTQAIDSHWRSRRIEWNHLSYGDQNGAGWATEDK
ncbi:MAG: RNA ligase family protein [Pseudomonadales bacterium]|nr:RNA ligase family protein [Pseudomonadales bacterium]